MMFLSDRATLSVREKAAVFFKDLHSNSMKRSLK
jgi:hypothetical protein